MNDTPDTHAELTVAVCTYRRFPWLKKCLEALERQTIDRNRFRVIVVDNSLLPAESAGFRDSLRPESRPDYIITDRAGLSHARNVALGKCRTPYIAYIDDDAIASPDWAEHLLAAFNSRNGAAGVIGGKVRPIFETPKPAWLAGELLLYLAIPDWGDQPFDLSPGDGKWLVGANIAYLTQALRAAGGFPEQLGRKENLLLCHEEYWINQAIRRQGLAERYQPDVVVDHLIQSERMTPEWLCEAAFWEAVSWVLCNSGTSTCDHLADAGKRQRLAQALQNRMGDVPQNPQTQAMERLCLEFKKLGHDTMRELGLGDIALADTATPVAEPTIFIVTTCRNAAATIDQTIRSIVTQAGRFWLRYHIQDAGSTDNTVDIIRQWMRSLQNNTAGALCNGVSLSYSVEPDSGMYDGINRAFRHLNIPADAFMTWLNADDTLFPGAIATIADIQQKMPLVEWVTGHIYCTRTNGGLCQATPYGFPRWFIQRGFCETRYWQCIQQEGTFWRKQLWDKTEGLDASLKLAGDFDLWRRFAEHAELWHFQGPLASFHRRSGQLSESFDKYAEEIDARVPLEQKNSDWQWALSALKDGSNPFTVSCLRYDWDSDSYKEEFRPVCDFLPQWKRDIFAPGNIGLKAEPATSAPAISTENVQPPVAPAEPEQPVSLPAPQIPPQEEATAACHPQSARRKGLGFAVSLKHWLKQARDYRALRKSQLFCDAYYLHNYPDVAALGIDPLLHYLRHGWREGRNPNPLFQTSFYLQHNPDVAQADANPLLHYWMHGAAEGRDPGETFNTMRYLEEHPKLRESGANPLAHRLGRALSSGLPHSQALEPQNATPPDPLELPAAPPPPAVKAGLMTITPETFKSFTFSKNSHLPLLAPFAVEVYGRAVSAWDDEDLKTYQDLLAYAFIRQNIPAGSRILEIGGGLRTPVLNALAGEYECWNIDRFAKQQQPCFTNQTNNIYCVNDYIGAASQYLPEDFFAFAFSISVFEDARKIHECAQIMHDTRRVLKKGAYVLHLSSAVLNNAGCVSLPALFRHLQANNSNCITVFDGAQISRNADVYYLSEKAYNRLWMPYTKVTYSACGHPLSVNLLCG